MTLQELGIKHNTDKATFHKFCDEYQKFLGKNNIESIVEVGIFDGGSLRMWSEFYPKAKVVGIDIDRNTFFDDGHIVSYYGDQSEPKVNILPLVKQYDCDLFVDDGSHLYSHQIKTFESIFPNMKDGSFYILEDLHTSLWRGTEIGTHYDDNEITPLDYLKQFLTDTNLKHKFIFNDNGSMISVSCIIQKN